MSRLWPLLSAVLIAFLLLLVMWSDNSDAAQALTLNEAVRIALERNLTMADSRLAVTEKEYQRREAFSDFFPLAITQYDGIVDRYGHPDPFYNLKKYSISNNGLHDSRYSGKQQAARMAPLNLYPTYPYRIDPFRQFTVVLRDENGS